MTDPTFAKPVKELGAKIDNTPEPAAGLGLTLDEAGLVPTNALGTGTPSASTVLLGDRSWAAKAPNADTLDGLDSTSFMRSSRTFQANSSADLTTTTTPTDITGATLTLANAGDYLIFATFDMDQTAAGTGSVNGLLVVNGATQTPTVILVSGAAHRYVGTRPYLVTGIGAGQIVKLQGSKGIAAGTGIMRFPHTTIAALQIA